MKIRRWWIGSDGLKYTHVPTLLSEAFGISESEGLRLLRSERVELDGETTQRRDMPVNELAGKQLSVGREVVRLEAE